MSRRNQKLQMTYIPLIPGFLYVPVRLLFTTFLYEIIFVVSVQVEVIVKTALKCDVVHGVKV